MFRRLAAVFAATALTALLAAPVLASNTYTLNQFLDDRNPNGIAWDAFQVDCSDAQAANLQEGQVLWVFVAHVTSGDPSSFLLTATFEDSSQNVSGVAPAQPIPDSEPHWFVITNQTTLLSATITGDGTIEEQDATSNSFNLSHVCPAPGVPIPEAPMSAMLLVSAAILGMGFVVWRKRRAQAVA